MTVGTFLVLDLAAAAVLALWVTVRYASFGPRSIRWAALGFLVGQCAPTLGLWVLPDVVRLTWGPQLALLGVILPVFFVMFLTVAWLMRACANSIGGPRGGHRVRLPGWSRS
ncbi:MAG TPA: hypothetical protein VFI04_04035 [Gaiellaceae bacterium]|nr:hypothetical protein [Gaiellaceae bacterium]